MTRTPAHSNRHARTPLLARWFSKDPAAIELDGSKKLFGGDTDLFTRAVEGAISYGEYGMGKSTLWIDRNTEATIHAVETSGEWTASVRQRLVRSGHNLAHVDVGPLGQWGYPEGYSRRDNFVSYVEAIWSDGQRHDVVLIDGRFRVASFLTTLLRATPGTRIVFDDYRKRPHYHVVEELVRPQEFNSRQALFVAPDAPNREKVRSLRDSFLYVRE